MLALEFAQKDTNTRISLPDASGVTGSAIWRWLRADPVIRWQTNAYGKKAAVSVLDQYALSRTLIALDGIADSIILVPADATTSERIEEIRSQLGFDFLVTDADEARFNADVQPPPPILGVDPIDSKLPFSPLKTSWVLSTSGTTRQPKLVNHTFQSLTRTVSKRINSGRRQCWALLYDLNRFAGLQVFFQSICGNGELFIPPRDSSSSELVDALVKGDCTCISATPTLWRKLLMHPACRNLKLDQITLGGEICDQPVLDALRAAFPNTRISHIYASTEAGVGFSVHDGREGFPAAFLLKGPSGVSIRISELGILELRTPNCEQTYVGQDEQLLQASGFISTGDRVRLDGDRVFFLGRDSGAINVGGSKVQPEVVERVLLGHPNVVAAKVSGRRSSFLGNLVQAVLVVKDETDTPAFLEQIKRWCGERLKRHEIPAFFSVVNDLPIEGSGKLSRRSMET